MSYKAGETATFTLNGCELKVAPLPFGRLKKIMSVVLGITTKMADAKGLDRKEFLAQLPSILGDNMTEMFLVLFDAGTHPFMNAQWLEQNMTAPMARQIIEAAVAVNGMQDFLEVPAAAPAPTVERPLSEAQPPA